MITFENFPDVLSSLGFTENNGIFTKHFAGFDCDLKADFKNKKLIYPTEKGLEVNDGTTSNFEHNENFVVFECVTRLLEKGYRPEHIELEPRWSLGHGGKSGKADICVKNKDGSEYLCIIECKTFGEEFKKETQNMKEDGGQLFSYWQQARATKWLVLYASDFSKNITRTIATVNCSDDANFVELAKDDKTLKLYKDAATAKDLFEVWKETYEQKFLGDIIFDDETVPYDIGVLPLKKKRLVDFSRDDKIVNQFEEILRHNNVSDKENAFNRLIALFIAKLYDEKTKTDESEVEFQYKAGTDTYQKMQDRLQKLHHFGMKEFMKEDVFYVADDYVEKVISRSLQENRPELEAELNETITKLKFYTNNDFSFKDVHNKTLFYQNGKILVEMVELFQKYRIIDSKQPQLLGDMFEQLLNKGFKQNEGQFFTPVPICTFIWKCLPLESVVVDKERLETHYPKIIDYACGAGHFLTEGFREINEIVSALHLPEQKGWERDAIFGIEKDYRLARVSKISLFMHGADNGNIVFGDGLDNQDNEGIVVQNGMFDILVANPPYSVSAFKNHLELKHNSLKLLDYISKDGKEIETLFVERIGQLLRPNGIAAVILPSSILTNSSLSYIKAREEILKNFEIRAIVQFGSKTFGATGTNTVVLYLKKYNEPPVKSACVRDIVSAVFENKNLALENDKKIFASYCAQIEVPQNEYLDFLKDADENADFEKYKSHAYFDLYVKDFEQSAEAKKLSGEKLFKTFYSYVLQTEKDKLYYFALAANQKTLVVSSPQENAAQEKFLGYTWSNRKGDEGIKIKSENPDESCGLLYNTRDEEHSIARYVKDAFLGIYRSNAVVEPAETAITKYITVNNLCDMIDFSRATFDKAIKTSGKLTIDNGELKSKFPLVKLGEIAEIIRGVTFDKQFQTNERTKNIVLTADNITLDGHFVVAKEIFVSNKVVFDDSKRLRKNDCFMCFSSGSRTHVGKVAFIDKDTNFYAGGFMGILRAKNGNNPEYLYEILNSENARNIIRASANGTNILNLSNSIGEFKIPLPPLDVQKEIVAECEKVDSEYQNAEKEIDDCKNQISQMMANVKGEKKRLSEICSVINPSKSDIRDIPDDTLVSFVDMPSVSNDGFIETKIDRRLKDIRKGGYTYFAENDIIIAKITPCMENGKCAIARNLTNKIGMGSSEFHVFRIKPDFSTKFVFAYLNRNEIRNMAQKVMTGASGHRRVPITFYEDLQIPLPPLSVQQKIAAEISKFEEKITDAKKIIASCPEKKREVLRGRLEK